MTTYVVTEDNWNDPAFWASISPSGDGHTLDFSALPSNYHIDFASDYSFVEITKVEDDNTTTPFRIGDANYTGGDASFGGSTELSQFSNFIANDGSNTAFGTEGDESFSDGDGDAYFEGGGGDDTLDGGDGDDLLYGGEGDDVVYGGDGEDGISGGDGNDTIDAGANNDLAFGGDGNDSISGGADTETSRLGFKWSELPDPDDGGQIDDGDVLATATQTVGSVDVTFEYVGDGTNSGYHDGETSVGGIDGGDDTVNPNSSWDIRGEFGDTSEIDLTFSEEVENVAFRVNDVDHNVAGGSSDQVTILAFDALGNPIPVTLTFGSSVTGSDTDGVSGDDTGTGTTASTRVDEDASILVEIPGPVAEIQIIYEDLSSESGTGYINITDVFFDQTATVESGDDTLSGQAGDDTIMGYGGDDSLDGGDDADTFVIHDGFGNDTIVGGEGGTDTDTIDLSALGGAVTVTYTGDEAGTITDGTDTITFSEIEHLILTDSSDSVDGTGADNGINVSAEDGDDTIIGSTTNSDSSDTIDGGAGNDVIVGGAGNDSLVGGDGNDTIDGGDSSDTIFGGDGDDVIEAGEEANFGDDDSIEGGAGNDTITSAETDSRSDDTVRGGEGDDVISMAGGTNTLYGDAGNDTISSGAGDDYIDGGDGADTFRVFDNFGNDQVAGGDGGTDDDTIDLSALTGPVTVTYTGNDAGTITDGTDTITFSEIENLILTDHADVVDLAEFTGNISAGAGNDTVNNITDGVVDGGSGDDEFDIDHGAGTASVIGGSGSDRLKFDSDNVEGVSVTLTDTDAGTYDWASAGGGSFEGMESYELSAQDDNFDGSAASDAFYIEGDGGNDTISGGSGDDTIFAGSGDDSVSGGDGDDSIAGGTGDDTITGADGDDTIRGGGGDDTFTYSVGDGADTITDFNAGNSGTLSDGDTTNNDYIDLTGFYDNLWELYADQADDGVLNQSNTTDLSGNAVDYSDNSEFGPDGSLTFTGASADNSSFTSENTGVACFTKGTTILTPQGEVPIETLTAGDTVVLAGGRHDTILWIGRSAISTRDQARFKHLRPICLPAGMFGLEQNLVVSRPHCIAGEAITSALSGLLVPAAQLANNWPGVLVAQVQAGLVYYHILLPGHALLVSNGLPSESFYPGPLAMSYLAPDTKDALFDAAPNLRGPDPALRYGPRLRPKSRGKDIRRAVDARARGRLRRSDLHFDLLGRANADEPAFISTLT